MIWSRIGRSPVTDMRIMNELFPAAEAAAQADGASLAGAEYLLVAALELEDGTGRRAFERVGANPDDFGTALREQHAEALEGIGLQSIDDELLDRHLPPAAAPIDPVKTAPSARKMFRSIVKKVRKERSQLYSAYFVLAAAEAEHGTTIRAIRHMGVDPAALADAARTEIQLLVGASDQ